MSEENVEIIRRAFQAFNERDVETMLGTFREGLVIAVDNYYEANEALEAAGLRE